MTSKSKADNCQQVAQEAIFQLDCCREFSDWMLALMTAIRNDQKHSDGKNVPGLSNLGVYLAETHLGDVEQSFELLSDGLSSLGGAA